MMVGENTVYEQKRSNDEPSYHSRSWNYPSSRSWNTNRTRRDQRCQPNRNRSNDCNLHTSLYGSRRTNLSNKTLLIKRGRDTNTQRVRSA